MNIPKRQSIFSLIAVYIFSDVLNRSGFYLLIPLYTYVLSPTEFGVLGITKIFLPVATLLFSFGLQGALFNFYFVYKTETEKSNYYGTIWIFLLIGSGISIAVTCFLGFLGYLDFFKQLTFWPYIAIVLSTSYFRISFEMVLLQYLRAKEAGPQYFWLNLTSFVITIIFQLAFLLIYNLGVLGVLYAELISSIIMAVIYSFFLIKYFTLNFNFTYLLNALKYSLPLLPHYLALWILNLSNRIILEQTVSLTEVGIYSLADQFRQANQLIFTGANRAIMPIFGKARDKKERLDRIPFIATLFVFFVVGVSLLTAIFSNEIIQIIAPIEFSNAATLIPILLFGVIFLALYFIPANFILYSLGRTKIFSIATLIAGGLNIWLNIIMIPKYGVIAAAINSIIGYLCLLLILTIAMTRYKTSFEFDQLSKIFLAGTIVFVLSSMVNGGPIFTRIIIKLIIFCLYIVILKVFGFFRRAEMVEQTVKVRAFIQVKFSLLLERWANNEE